MAAYLKYQCFAKDLAEKKHDLSSDIIKVALTNRAPVLATDRVLADIGELAAGFGFGYGAGGKQLTLISSSQAAGTYSLKLNDPQPWVAATGGVIGPFRWTVIYNATANLLIAAADRAIVTTLNAGERFGVDVDQVNGLFTFN